MKKIVLFALVLSVIVSVAMAAETTPAKTTTAPAVAATPTTKTPKTVSIQASDLPVREVIKTIADGTGETILVEKIVDGKVSMSLEGVTAEKALDAVAKSLKLQWRKVYVDSASVLAKDGDALASQMRTVLSVKFPDMIVSGSTKGNAMMHFQRDSSVTELTKSLPSSLGLKAIYILTDDEKANKKEIKDESKKKIASYVESYKKLLDDFINMSPEERSAVMRESMGLVNQMSPDVLKDMMTSMFEMDPEYVSQMNSVGMQAIFSMSPEGRKTMIRNSIRQQMELMKSLTPEQMQELQQIAAEAATEMMNEGNNTQQ